MKTKYIKPVTEATSLKLEQTMITASPGVTDDGYKPGDPIDSRSVFIIDANPRGREGYSDNPWQY